MGGKFPSIPFRGSRRKCPPFLNRDTRIDLETKLEHLSSLFFNFLLIKDLSRFRASAWSNFCVNVTALSKNNNSFYLVSFPLFNFSFYFRCFLYLINKFDVHIFCREEGVHMYNSVISSNKEMVL